VSLLLPAIINGKTLGAGGALLAATAASQDQSECENETFDCEGGHQDVDDQTWSPDREYSICASAITHQQASPTV